MPVYLLGEDIHFPPVDYAEDGLLAVGGDLSVERLLHAYSEGIFPWYSEGQPILWHSPDPRFVLTTDTFRAPRRLKRLLRTTELRLTMDSAFAEVIRACATARRHDGLGTWITAEMEATYNRLHRLGYAHSVEAWRGDALAGGLYGVSLGAVFFGESMFARESDASKIAFASLVPRLAAWGIHLIDCQVYTDHLARFGAEAWPRQRYIRELKNALAAPTRKQRWSFEDE